MDKRVMYIFIGVGGTIGGYIPILFGAGGLSLWSIIGSTIGGIIGIILANRV